MTTHEAITVGLTVACLVLASLFAAIEESFQAITKGRARKLADDGVPGAQRVVEIAEDAAPTVSTALFLRLTFEVLGVLLLADIMYGYIEPLLWRLLATGAIAVVVLFVLGGVLARTLGRQHATAIALRFSPLMNVLTTVLFIIPQVMIWFGNWITPGRGFPDGPFASEDELREYVDMAEQSNQIEAGERKMIHSVFELGDTLVREVMVPRPEIVYIEATKTLRQALSLALRSGFSRIPVVGPGGLDDIAGILFLKDIVRRVYDNPDSQSQELVTAHMRPVTWCPDSKPVDDLLREMQNDHSHLVVIVDEFGGTAGLATIEDILEEIVGEIVDEYDDEIEPVVALGDGRYRVASRLSLDDLGDIFGLDTDDEDVDSVGGIMAKQLNRVPIPGATVVWEGLELVADRPLGRRNTVSTIVVRHLSPDETGAAGTDSQEDDA